MSFYRSFVKKSGLRCAERVVCRRRRPESGEWSPASPERVESGLAFGERVVCRRRRRALVEICRRQISSTLSAQSADTTLRSPLSPTSQSEVGDHSRSLASFYASALYRITKIPLTTSTTPRTCFRRETIEFTWSVFLQDTVRFSIIEPSEHFCEFICRIETFISASAVDIAAISPISSAAYICIIAS